MSKFKFDGIKAVKEADGIVFYAIDAKGKVMEGGKLFTLLYRGVLLMHKNVSPDLGLKLDKEGHIIVEGVNDK